MTLSFTKITKLTFAMLVFASAAFFVVPAKEEVHAQSGGSFSFCFNSTTGATVLSSNNRDCPSGSSLGSARNPGVCVAETSSSTAQNRQYAYYPPTLDANTGVPKLRGNDCLSADATPVVIGQYRAKSAMQTYNASGGATTPPTTTPPTTTPPTGGGNTNTGGNTGGSTGSGGCESGFRKVGPLCVPASPFNNSDSITGEQTVGGLAARIISWLLYFAGIVAVIMMIIGGYQIMTAAGNATQAANGRKTLTNAIIGLVIIILSYIIIQAVISFVT